MGLRACVASLIQDLYTLALEKRQDMLRWGRPPLLRGRLERNVLPLQLSCWKSLHLLHSARPLLIPLLYPWLLFPDFLACPDAPRTMSGPKRTRLRWLLCSRRLRSPLRRSRASGWIRGWREVLMWKRRALYWSTSPRGGDAIAF